MNVPIWFILFAHTIYFVYWPRIEVNTQNRAIIQMEKYAHIFSLGYRCSSAGILKSLGLKQESFPFDWLVSRLPIIEHCVKTEFSEFLNVANYTKQKSATYGYPTADPNSRQWICDESMRVNHYYEFAAQDNHLYLVPYLTPTHDAYSYRMMMNHHDITQEKDREYYVRCVDRWNRMFESPGRKLSLYIHPVIFKEYYDICKDALHKDLRRFHRELNATKHDGIYIIPVKTSYDDPTSHCAKYVLEEQPDDDLTPNCRICVLWTNNKFIDAGEIFMGKCFVETYVIKEYVWNAASSGRLA